MYNYNIIKFSFILLSVIIILSCSKKYNSPEDAVYNFIEALVQKDISKAWNLLSDEIQNEYNSKGEKMRKSGKGAFENEISRIKKFNNDFTIENDGNYLIILLSNGSRFPVKTEIINKSYVIADMASLNRILSAITLEAKDKKVY
jgi:uncharacterized protein involved in exopolysaccharide biosynthesis